MEVPSIYSDSDCCVMGEALHSVKRRATQTVASRLIDTSRGFGSWCHFAYYVEEILLAFYSQTGSDSQPLREAKSEDASEAGVVSRAEAHGPRKRVNE